MQKNISSSIALGVINKQFIRMATSWGKRAKTKKIKLQPNSVKHTFITHEKYRNGAFSIQWSLDLAHAFVHYNLDYCIAVQALGKLSL